MPKVSILIPASRRDIDLTLQSVFDQTCQDYEILIAYDKTRYEEKLNDLAKIARGEFLLVLCDDDRLDPYFLENTLAASEGYDIVYTDIKTFGDLEQVWPGNPFTAEVLKVTTAPWITSLIRKSVWCELGGADASGIYWDWDFYIRCFKAGKKAFCVHEPLFIYQVHQQSESAKWNHQERRLKMKQKHNEIIV